ncbi:MAG: hypothetical protein FWC42_05320 [Proteobacteria bacterium]|nr:hypothetical protein [Pseudomonadota bacterium]
METGLIHDISRNRVWRCSTVFGCFLAILTATIPTAAITVTIPGAYSSPWNLTGADIQRYTR